MHSTVDTTVTFRGLDASSVYSTSHCQTAVRSCVQFLSTFIATLKPQSNGPSYSNIVIGTMAVDGWADIFGTVIRGLGGAPARPGPSSLYQS